MIVFTCILYIISLMVYLGTTNKENMWSWIVAYWAVLTFKNMIDLIGGLL